MSDPKMISENRLVFPLWLKFRQLGALRQLAYIPEVSDQEIPLVFIRVPYINEVSEEVEILLKIHDKITACRQGNMLVTSFHPELTKDLSHQYFDQIKL